jgi:hypothetical protein
VSVGFAIVPGWIGPPISFIEVSMGISISIPEHQRYAAGEAWADRVKGQDIADAAYNTAHGGPGGIAALATRMGVNADTLTAKVNQRNTTHHLSLREAVSMQHFSGDHAILHAMAEALGYTCSRATPDQSGGDPTEAIMRMEVAHADLLRALADGVLAGPQGVTGNHMRRAVHMAEEAIATIGHALAMLRGRMRPAPPTE